MIGRLSLALAPFVVLLAATPRPAAADPVRGKVSAATYGSAEDFIYAHLKRCKKLSYPGWRFSLSVRSLAGTALVEPVIEYLAADGTVEVVMRGKEGCLHVDRRRNVLVIQLKQVAGTATADGSIFKAEKRVQEFHLPPDFGR